MNFLLRFFGLTPLAKLQKSAKMYVDGSRGIKENASAAAKEIDDRIKKLDVRRSAALDVKNFVSDLDKIADQTTADLDKIANLK